MPWLGPGRPFRRRETAARTAAVGAPGRPALPPPEGEAQTLAGMANVSAIAFVAGRAVPLGSFVALIGGVPLGRAAAGHGLRAGYATAIAALVETVALMGPARMSVPIPQALSAPWVGALHERGRPVAVQVAAGALVRFGYYVVTAAAYVGVLVGPRAYLGTYAHVRRWVPALPAGHAGAVLSTLAYLAAYAILAAILQVWAFTRGLDGPAAAASASPPATAREARPPLDVRAALPAASLAFAATLLTTRLTVLGAVSAWLALVWVLVRASRRTLLLGAALAVPLALTTLGFGVAGSLSAGLAGRRALRAVLLVLLAVWLRAAVGPAGLRTASLATVRLLSRAPTLALAGRVLAESAGAADYGAAVRRLGDRLRQAPKRPAAVVDATIAWMAAEPPPPASAGPSSSVRWSPTATAVCAASAMLALALLSLLATA